MTKQEIENIRESSAKNGGDLDKAIAVFLDLELEHKYAGGVPLGCEGSFNAVRLEVEAAAKAKAK